MKQILQKMKQYVLVLLLVLMGNYGWGQTTIAGWDFFGQSSPATFAATTFNTNLVSTSSANTITRGPDASSSSGSNSFRTTGFQNNGISTNNTDYFQITLEAATNYKVSLSTIDAKFVGTSSFYTSPGVISQFAYSLDGTTFTLIGSPVQSTSLTMSQISLSEIPALQNVAAGTTITLRYYASGRTTTGGWGFSSTSSGNNGLAIGGSVESLGSNTISIGTLTGAPFCVDGTNGAAGTLAYTSTGTYNGTFTAQLSDANGSFDSPVAIGTGTSPIAVNIPAGTALGSGYRVRVVNDDPATVGTSSTAFSVINTPPTITTPTSTSITASSAVLGGNVTGVGCNTITERGIYYSTTNGFADGDGTKVSETSGPYSTGTFTVNVSGLTSVTTYYYKAFATSASGTSYTTEATFSTPVIAAPQANAATGVGATSFTANWDAVAGATSYEIDVYKINLTSNTTTETFTSIGGGTSTSYLTRTWTGNDNINWTAYKSRIDQVILSGNAALTLENSNGSYLESGEITGNPSNITFDIKQAFSGSGGAITLSILHGASFGTTTQIGVYSYTTSTQNIVAPISGIMGPFKVVLLNNAAARPTIDNLAITRLTASVSYILQNQDVGNVTSYQVTGLDQNTTYYYVVRAIDATSESVNSNEITTTTAIVSTTWNGTAWSNSAPTASVDAIIDGDLTTSGNLTCEDLTINSGKTLTIAAGTTLSVSGNLVNNGSIIFKSNNTSTGRFDTYSGNIITGTGSVTMERYIDGKRAFRFLAPGVNTSGSIADNWQQQVFITGSTTVANAGGFDVTETGAPSMFTFEDSGWTAIANTGLTLNAQKGYRILIRGDRTPSILTSPSNGTMNTPVTLTATGTMVTGDVPYTTLPNQEYTLVANPYISPINWATVTKSNISDTYYAWDPNLGTGNQRGRYVSCDVAGNTNIISGTGGPSTDIDQFIQPGQAVFIQKTTSGVNGSVTIKETDKAATFTDVFRTPNNSSNAINGKLGVNLYESLAYSLGEYPIDGAVVVSGTTFNTNSASDDTKKIMSHGEQVAFVRDNIQLGVEKISAPQENDELSIACINLVPNKNYVWSVVLQDDFSNEDTYLYDAFTQIYHPIQQNSVISFSTNDNVNSTLTNRFKIVFQNSALSTDDFANNIKLYPNPAKAGGSFYIDGIAEATVSVYNVVGQNIPVTIMSQGNAVQVTPKTALSQGVYLVTVTTAGKTAQVKWIVE